MLCMPRISRSTVQGTHYSAKNVHCELLFLVFVAIVHINIVYLVQLLNNPRALYLPAHPLVLIDEASQRGICRLSGAKVRRAGKTDVSI